MIKFTPEEISLCRQVAEKHRKEIEYGDWMIIEGDPHEIPALYIGQEFTDSITKDSMLPLWTISDCLEFLREKGYSLETHEDIFPSKDVYIEIHKYIGEMDMGHIQRRGKTDLEACLKAVLAVLEEVK